MQEEGKDQMNFQEIHFIKDELDKYLTKKAINIECNVNESSQIEKQFIDEINQKFIQQHDTLMKVVAKASAIFKAFHAYSGDTHMKIAQLNESIEEKNHHIETLNDSLQLYQKKNQDHQIIIEKAKQQIIQLQQKIENQERNYKKQQKQLKRTFRQVQQITEVDRKFSENVILQNQNLLQQLTIVNTENEENKEQIKELKKRISEFQMQFSRINIDLHFEQNKTHSLSEQLEESRIQIHKLQNQLELLHQEIQEHQSHDQAKNLFQEIVENEMQNHEITKNNLTVHLSEEMPFRNSEDFDLNDFRKRQPSELKPNYQDFDNFFQQKENVNDENNKDNSTQKTSSKKNLDPYFAHFILTSQAVKIKQDCEQLLNIDVKPYYKQIVEKRIPMHLWDQWIRNRLRELFKALKVNSTGKEEDQT